MRLREENFEKIHEEQQTDSAVAQSNPCCARNWKRNPCSAKETPAVQKKPYSNSQTHDKFLITTGTKANREMLRIIVR